MRTASILLGLSLLLTPASQASNDFTGSETTLSSHEGRVHWKRTVRQVLQTQQDLFFNGEIQFESSASQRRYRASMRKLQSLLQSDPNDPGSENYRGRASAHIEQEVSSAYKQDAIAALPPFVHKSDYDFVVFLVDDQSSIWVPKFLTAYFKHHQEHGFAESKKGEAGKLLVEELSRIYLEACLALLPAKVTADDLVALQSILDNNSNSRVEQAMRNYFQTQ